MERERVEKGLGYRIYYICQDIIPSPGSSDVTCRSARELKAAITLVRKSFCLLGILSGH